MKRSKAVISRFQHRIPNSPTMTVPLRTDEHGAIRIGKTRVLLELVIHAYYLGETPEGIVESYPSQTAADVYAVLGYYLANPEAIDAYVRRRDQQVDQNLREMEATLTHDLDTMTKHANERIAQADWP